MKIKLICGFRTDQEYSIDIDEAHKAYYLFRNPDARAIFRGGLAITGSSIKEIVPDWHGTMGWNPSHRLDADDWNEIERSGKGRALSASMALAETVGNKCSEEQLAKPLGELKALYPKIASRIYANGDSIAGYLESAKQKYEKEQHSLYTEE